MTDGHDDPSVPEHLTVLEALGARLGTTPKLNLKDEESGHAGAPVLRATPDEMRAALPQGKGNYQLLGELARGGMGVVIKGHDTDLCRDVALKVLHEELAEDPVIVSRFVEEAQIGGQLQHPGIVPVYELGLMADERPFFTMKLVKGRTLSALLRDREELTEDRRRFLTIFEQVCQTVAYAHSRDVIHRDLKPSNVMVGAFGEVQVVDWGLAKVLGRSGDPHATRSRGTRISTIETVRTGSSTTASDSVAGAVMGTPAFMPPEQARGELEDLCEKADVFALGGILCEVLTGEPPYPGPKDHALALAENADQVELDARLSKCGADTDLVDLALECLSPEPSNRPRDAGILAHRVGSYLAALEERARRAEVRAARTLGLSASVLVTLLVAAGTWIWTASERSRVEREEVERERTELVERTEREREEEAARATHRRKTEELVSAALSEASFARARGEWRVAQASVEHASAVLQSESYPDLNARVGREVERLSDAETLATEKRDREEQLAHFLDGVERSRGDFWFTPIPEYRIVAYERAFEEFGLDLQYLDEDEFVGAAQESGRPVEVARALDDLARFHKRALMGSASRMLRLAKAMDPDPLRIQIRDALQDGDYVAIRSFAMELDPGELSPVTALVLAGALQTVPLRGLCIRILEGVVDQNPGERHLRVLLGELLLARDPDQALLHLSVAHGLESESPFVFQLMGRAHRELGNTELAEKFLREAVRRHPEEPQAHIHLALALRRMGDEPGALRELGLASGLLPGCVADYVAEHVRMCKRLFDGRGFRTQTEWPARQAIALDEESAEGHFWLGASLWAQGRYLEARDSEERAIEIEPEHAFAHNNLGLALYGLGLYEEAIESYERQLLFSPNHVYAHGNLGDALLEVGRGNDAIAAMREHVAIRSSDTDSRLLLGQALYHQEAFEDSLVEYQLAVANDPEYCQSHFYLAAFRAHVPDDDLRDASAAIELAQSALEVHEAAAALRDGGSHGSDLEWSMIGEAYYRADRFEDAVNALNTSRELGGDDESHRMLPFFLAMAHQQLRAEAEARKWYDEGVTRMGREKLGAVERKTLEAVAEEARALLGD